MFNGSIYYVIIIIIIIIIITMYLGRQNTKCDNGVTSWERIGFDLFCYSSLLLFHFFLGIFGILEKDVPTLKSFTRPPLSPHVILPASMVTQRNVEKALKFVRKYREYNIIFIGRRKRVENRNFDVDSTLKNRLCPPNLTVQGDSKGLLHKEREG